MSSPFKFLNAFTKEDKAYFFGRDEEINRAYDMVFKTRIGVILGESGTGKTSLVQCGLANRFETTDWKDIYIRRKSNFNDALLEALQKLYKEPQKADYLDAIFADDFLFETGNGDKPTAAVVEQQTTKEGISAVDMLEAIDVKTPKSLVERIYRKYHTPLYLIFDQFEELFISGDKEGAEKCKFIENIKDIARSKVPCVMLFVMREEYLAQLHDFEKAIPTFFDHRLRVEQVTEGKAKTIVERLLEEAKGKKFPANPTAGYNGTPELLFDYEPTVPELIVKKVAEGQLEVKLPFLQIYLSMLYLLGASKGEDNVVFTPALVEGLGSMNKVLRSFVNDRIIEAEGLMENKKAALNLLKTLVTERGTKKMVALEELKFYASHYRISENDLHEFLRFFSEQHILRDLEGNYELTHDELAAVISAIRPWEQSDVPQITGSPFKGLSPYESEDALLFFGRDGDIQAILALLRLKNFVVVTGASGTGKSSVIKAGVLPRLQEEGFGFYEILRPGNQPVHTLQKAIEKLKEKKSTGKGFVLLIDQFEELLTRGVDKAQVAKFYELLKKLVESPAEILPDVKGNKQFKLIVTVRSDFEPHFEQSILKQHWKQGRFLIPLPGPKELIEIVERPAALSACRFEPEDLSNRIAGEVAGRVSALPLLSFALHLMYEKSLSNGRVIDEKIYDAVGGVIGSLRTHADEIYAQLPDDAHRRTMRQIMLRMVSMEGTEYASRRVPLAELAYPDEAENQRVHAVIEMLCEERLIVRKTNEAKEWYVEPAHDALLWGWSTLWEWIRDFGKECILIRDRIVAAVAEWKREGKGSIGLWTEEKKLAELKDLLSGKDVWLNNEEIEFAKACLEEREKAVLLEEEKEREKQQLVLDKMEAEKRQLISDKKVSEEKSKRRKYLAWGGVATGVICFLLTLWAFNQREMAMQYAQSAKESEEEAKLQRDSTLLEKLKADSLAIIAMEASEAAEAAMNVAGENLQKAKKEEARARAALAQVQKEKEATEEQRRRAIQNLRLADLRTEELMATRDSLVHSLYASRVLQDSLMYIIKNENALRSQLIAIKSDSLFIQRYVNDSLKNELEKALSYRNFIAASDIIATFREKTSKEPYVRTYQNGVSDGTRYRGVWLPDANINLGDYGYFNESEFKKLGNIRQSFNISFEAVEYATGTITLKGEKVEFSPMKVGTLVRIPKNNYFALIGESTTFEIKNLNMVAAEVERLYKTGKWERRWLIVSELAKTDNGAIFIANRGAGEVRIDADFDGTTFPTGFKNLEHDNLMYFGPQLTPFFRVVGLREDYKGK